MSKPKKRKGSPFYWYDFTVGGHRFRGSTETDCLETAKSIVAKLRTDALLSRNFGDKKKTLTLDQAIGKYLIEHAQHLKSYKTIIGHCKHIIGFLGGKTALSSITNRDVNDFVASLRNGKTSMSDTTINRVLETFRKILNIAKDKWEVETPDINFRKHMLREPEARTRWITHDDAERLIECAATHLKAPIRFALLTGVRLSNITGLRWRDINMLHRKISFRIKSNIPDGKTLELPITQELFDLLESISNNPMPDDHVFTYRGNPIASSFRKAFNAACKRAQIDDFRFHDLRHTAASWMVQSGVPIDLAQEILGHTQIATTKKYAHREQSEKLKALEMMNSSATQSRHTENKGALKRVIK